jgi:hypothetical protein
VRGAKTAKVAGCDGMPFANGSGRTDFDDLTTVLANFGVVCL